MTRAALLGFLSALLVVLGTGDALAGGPNSCRPGTDITSFIDNGTFTGNLCGARDNTAGSCGSSGEDAGFLITAPFDGLLSLTTDGSTFDTILYVRETDCTGAEIDCDDDGGAGSQSALVIPVVAGQDYIVVVEGYGSACGDFDLTMTTSQCGDPGIDLSGYVNNGTFTDNSCGASDDSSGTCGSGGGEMAYSFIAPMSGMLSATTDGSSYDTVLYMREGSCAGPQLDCDDDGGTIGGASLVEGLAVTQGVEYWVFVEGYGSTCGDFDLTLTIDDDACEPADVVADLSCSSDLFGQTTAGGTDQLRYYECGSPYSSLDQDNPESIYAFHPQNTGPVTFVLDGMTNDQDLYVLENNCSTVDCIGGANAASTTVDSLTFDAVAGTTYYIVVEGYAGPGQYDLSFDVGSGGCNEDCNDGIDNDGDQDIDCADSDCFGEPECMNELCDGVDNNGDGTIDEGFPDTDGDGTADCVDVETCDVWDNDGDGTNNEGFPDTDGDGTADCVDTETCDVWDNDGDGTNNEGFPDTDGDGTADCIDPETCNGDDDDGNGAVDEGFPDTDGDGTADCVDTETCDVWDNDGDGTNNEGFADTDADGIADCIDTEECDGLDNNGNGSVDEGFADDDGDSIANCVDVETCDGVNNDADGVIDEGFPDTDNNGVADCLDSEFCDGADNDGDGVIDEGFPDTDGDGDADCVDPEECDGLDNDGDGDTDEGFADTDGDGVADCVDTEVCDGIDNNGNGAVDEGFGDDDSDGIANCMDVEECDGVNNDDDVLVDEGFDVDNDGIADCFDVEVCDGVDNDGDGLIDDADPDLDASTATVWYADGDGDGFGDSSATVFACDAPTGYVGNDTDCDDFNGGRNPAETEVCDGVDNDCDVVVDEHTECYDDDGDGFTELGGDCDDGSTAFRPSATEQCDSLDNDCDSATDEGTACVDDDQDGYCEGLDLGNGVVCTDGTLPGDCADGDPQVNPGETENNSNGVDDDCDAVVDLEAYDPDYDGYTDVGGDCAPADSSVYPGADEKPDGIDNDCDGTVDEGTIAGDDDGDGYTEQDGDCWDANPDVFPGATEIADGIDNDCDGELDEGTAVYDDDGDGLSETQGDCDDGDVTVHPGADETANGADDDCDGAVDEGSVDGDGDGYTVDQGDCDDAEGWAHPDLPEYCDGIDNNCDGEIDEGCDGDVVPPVDGSCGCHTAPALGWGALGLAGLFARRRRER